MPFFRDLCSGIVGNFRNCMTTPLTRKKLFIISGVVLTIILLIVIIAVSIPGASSNPKGSDALNNVPFVVGDSDFKAYLTTNFTVAGYNYDDHFKERTIGAQVIATSVACEAQFKDVVSQTIDQLDFIKRLVDASNFIKIAHSAQDIRTNKVNKHRSVVLALGGGHSLDNRLSTLRNYFNQGVRVVSLASTDCTNPWAKSINGDKNNITLNGAKFLKEVVAEMNRLGVAIDLAGSDKTVQAAVLDYSSAPVFYRGVGLKSLVTNDINLDNDIVEIMKNKSGSLAMLSLDCSLFTNNTDCTKKDFIAFLNDAKTKLGVSNIAIGGIVYPNGKMPKDLDYKDFPSLFDELMNIGWTIPQLELLAGNNFINFLQKVEEVARTSHLQPNEALFDIKLLNVVECYTPPPAPNPLPQPTPTSQTTTPTSQTTTPTSQTTTQTTQPNTTTQATSTPNPSSNT